MHMDTAFGATKICHIHIQFSDIKFRETFHLVGSLHLVGSSRKGTELAVRLLVSPSGLGQGISTSLGLSFLIYKMEATGQPCLPGLVVLRL